MTYDVALVMPAFNEADGIADFLEDLAGAFDDAGLDVLFVVVDDASLDDTFDVAKMAADRLGIDVELARNPLNLGHGPTSVTAWRRGIESGAPIIVHVDGDGQYTGRDVAAMAQFNGDGAIGVRISREDAWYRHVIAASLRFYVRSIAGVHTADANTPLRSYRSGVIAAMLDELPPNPMVPSVYLSVVGRVHGLDLDLVEVRSKRRRGDDPAGTTWGGGALQRFLPTPGFLSFVWNALRESTRILRAQRG